ncbi:MAG: hypothetical protein K8R69_04080 [Deltaproteobacteria bacterium]|nr:hypothetical protein [Deltaproteobacteria bacterium]
MGLGDLFKRFSKGPTEAEKKPEVAPRTKGGKTLPPLPAYLKKDSFLRDPDKEAPPTLSTQPEEVADAGSFKRPGKWLKERLGGATDVQVVNNIEKTKKALKQSGGMNDQEIQSFLDGFLEPEAGETPVSTSPALTKPSKLP